MSRLATLALLALIVGCEPGPKVDDSGVNTDDPWGTDRDEDGDGFKPSEGDCDESNGEVNPAAEELCDGVDNNCDEEIDEGVQSTWYADDDGDGFGDPAVASVGCENPGLPSTAEDCDDTDDAVHPSAFEVCNGVDDDCDGNVDDGVELTFYADADGDGFGDPDSPLSACEAPAGYASNALDCDDTANDAFPGNVEVCDEIDNNCDGAVDEGVTLTWYADTDGDGYGVPGLTQEACAQPTGYSGDARDCDDFDAAVHPDADEVCNELDDDCDGDVDEPDALDAGTWYTDADADGYGDPAVTTIACDAPAGTVSNPDDCDDTDASLNPTTTWYIDYDRDSYGSVDYTLNQCEQPAGYVRDATDCDDATADVSPAGTEVCNTIDDDCDGRVDDDDVPVSGTSTWYADADGDTYGDAATYATACEAPAGFLADDSDCDDTDPAIHPGATDSWYDGVDSNCDGDENPSVCDEVPGGTTVAYDDACAYPYASTGWSVATEWTSDTSTYYGSGNSYNQVMMTPKVGNLTDDNGDGVIDDDDIPDVVYTTFYDSSYTSSSYLRVVSGDGSGVHLNFRSVTSGSTTYYPAGAGGVALGDLEGDGVPDIVTITSGGDVLAITNTGTLKWVYPASFTTYAEPALADMDGDGDVEVMVGPTVLSSTGTLVGTCPYGSDVMPSFAADIDVDGVQELIVGAAVCEMNGGLVWNSGRTNGFPGVGNFDTDTAGEIVNVDRTNHRVDLLDDDGTLLWSRTLTGSGGGPPAIADFDGDGSPEIAVATSSRLSLLDTDGTVLWTSTIDDSSSYRTGASAFDFDGDGDAEVVYADENSVYVYNGATGSTIWSSTSHQSATLYEFPVVADVDRDGHAEIVLGSNDYNASGWAGVHVLGETDGNWASARFVYNQHGYSVTGVEDDLSIPGSPDPIWFTEWYGSRTQRSWSNLADGAADVAAVLLGVCEDCTNEEVDVYVSVENVGAVFAPDGVTVSVYAVDGAVETLLASDTTTDPLDPGERQAPMRFTIANADIGADGLLVVVDDGETVTECDESNNEASWDALTCPP